MLLLNGWLLVIRDQLILFFLISLAVGGITHVVLYVALYELFLVLGLPERYLSRLFNHLIINIPPS